MDEFERPIKRLDYCRARLYPITGVEILDVAQSAYCRLVYVPTHYALHFVTFGVAGNGFSNALMNATAFFTRCFAYAEKDQYGRPNRRRTLPI